MQESKDNAPASLDDITDAPLSLPQSGGALQQTSVEEVENRSKIVSDENFKLKLEVEELKSKLKTKETLDGLIEPYANRAFWFMCAYCFVVVCLLISSGRNDSHFHLGDDVLQLLVGSTAVTVIGLVGMVLTGVFVGARPK